MTITKGHYKLAGIVAAGIIIAAVIFRGCDNSPSHQEQIKEVKALQEQLRETEKEKSGDSARLARRADSLHAENLDLRNKQDVITRELATAKTKVQVLASANERAKSTRDTARYIETCDSLKDLARLQGELLEMYQFNDSARTVNYEEQLSAKDSLLANRAELIAELRRTNNDTYVGYLKMEVNYLQATRKLRRERTLSRVLAAGVAVLGGIVLLK